MFKDVNIEPFSSRVYLSSPTMHGEEFVYMKEAYDTNWMSAVGQNIDAVESQTCEKVGCKYCVALSSGTAALHMALKLAGEKLYGKSKQQGGALKGHVVLCSDLTFSASANPIVYEGGEPVFVDIERETWNMDPVALERAFERYPNAKIVVVVHLYGTPAKMSEIKAICDRQGAILIEDAAESLGATYKGIQTGSLGAYNCVSFNGNKIITGSSGGVLLTNDLKAAEQVRKWSTQSREKAAWYQHEELGYNYRMSNVVAGVVRGQFHHLDKHISQKKKIYQKYQEGLKDLPITLNPLNEQVCEPNYWLTCLLINTSAMCKQVRSAQEATYVAESGKTCPTEILAALESINAEGRPIWKPMHMQPFYCTNTLITREEDLNKASLDTNGDGICSVGADIFERGLCLPSDNKMTEEQQERIIEVIRQCFE